MYNTDEINAIAMNIILHSGDARTLAQKSLEEAKKLNFVEARKFLESSNQEIILAHKAQTDLVQAATSGEVIEYSVLFSHAQDTLMTIISEVKFTEQLIDVIELLK